MRVNKNNFSFSVKCRTYGIILAAQWKFCNLLVQSFNQTRECQQSVDMIGRTRHWVTNVKWSMSTDTALQWIQLTKSRAAQTDSDTAVAVCDTCSQFAWRSPANDVNFPTFCRHRLKPWPVQLPTDVKKLPLGLFCHKSTTFKFCNWADWRAAILLQQSHNNTLKSHQITLKCSDLI